MDKKMLATGVREPVQNKNQIKRREDHEKKIGICGLNRNDDSYDD